MLRRAEGAQLSIVISDGHVRKNGLTDKYRGRFAPKSTYYLLPVTIVCGYQRESLRTRERTSEIIEMHIIEYHI